MSATNAFETDLLELIFLNTAVAQIGDASGLQPSASAGSLYVSLSTDSPVDTMAQNTNELSYTGYSRQAVARTGSAWTVTGDTVDNDNLIQFGNMSAGGPETAAAVIIGGEAAGAGTAIFTGTCSLVINNGVNPEYAAGDLDITLA